MANLVTPTNEAYTELQTAFDHFNRTLFGDALDRPLITLQRERRTYGYCSRQRFVSSSSGALVDEIALNPSYFAIRPIHDSLSTLVHEMVHQWQFHYGKPGRRGYHNQEWAEKMESVGLMPSNTGQPGGKKTGEKMTHYIVDGGGFDLACRALITTPFTLSWLDRYPIERPAPAPPRKIYLTDNTGHLEEENKGEALEDDLIVMKGVILPPIGPPNRSNRTKYICGHCNSQVWGKPGLNLLCGGRAYGAQEPETHDPTAMHPA